MTRGTPFRICGFQAIPSSRCGDGEELVAHWVCQLRSGFGFMRVGWRGVAACRGGELSDVVGGLPRHRLRRLPMTLAGSQAVQTTSPARLTPRVRQPTASLPASIWRQAVRRPCNPIFRRLKNRRMARWRSPRISRMSRLAFPHNPNHLTPQALRLGHACGARSALQSGSTHRQQP